MIINSKKISVEMSLQLYGKTVCPKDWGETDQPTFHRIYYVYSGTAKCHVYGVDYALKPGHLYFFPTNTVYTLSHDGDDPLCCMYFHVHILPLITNGLTQMMVEEASTLYYQVKLIEGLIKMQAEERTLIEQLHSLLWLVGQKIRFEFLENTLVQKAIQIMSKQYDTKLTNETIAAQLGYNTNYYIKVFSEAMGISPQVYLDHFRLRKAIELLIKNYPIQEIAGCVGYSDSKSFSRFFKKNIGVSPSKYTNYFVSKI